MVNTLLPSLFQNPQEFRERVIGLAARGSVDEQEAIGAALVGFIALLCGSPLGGRWAAVFGLCSGSLIALFVWRLTGDVRGITAGIVSLLLLAAGWILAVRWVGRDRMLGRRARRWGARGFFLGLIAGAIIAMIPAVEWLLFWRSPTSLLLGATIGSGLGATLGMLAGASDNSSLRVESQPTAPTGNVGSRVTQIHEFPKDRSTYANRA